VSIWRAIAGLALAMLAACTSVTTNYPIGVAQGPVNDERILGAWTFVPKDNSNGAATAFILKQDSGHSGLLVIASENEWWEADIVPGKTGPHAMLNVRPRAKNGMPLAQGDKIDGYYPLRYTASADGNIALFLGSADTLSAAVRDKRIQGTESDGKIVLTAMPGALDAFFGQEAEAMFAEPYATLIRTK
jgi:hypothetical protein